MSQHSFHLSSFKNFLAETYRRRHHHHCRCRCRCCCCCCCCCCYYHQNQQFNQIKSNTHFWMWCV